MIPVTTIGGYLGAGKTTLINHLLRYAEGQRLAILVNEFGQLSIDADLIEAESDDIISIAGGCICCSFGNDMVGALRNLAALTPPPDHIVIEASGVALPSSVASSISLLPGFRLNGVVVLADAETVRDMAGDDYLGDTILRQLVDADLVLVTKSDLVTAEALESVSNWAQTTAPGAAILPVTQGRVAPDVVLGPKKTGPRTGAGGHSDALFESAVFPVAGPLDTGMLVRTLGDGDFGLLRAKGFLRDLSGESFLVQLVGRRVTLTPSDKPASGLVCIGRAGALDQSGLARVLEAARAVQRVVQG